MTTFLDKEGLEHYHSKIEDLLNNKLDITLIDDTVYPDILEDGVYKIQQGGKLRIRGYDNFSNVSYTGECYFIIQSNVRDQFITVLPGDGTKMQPAGNEQFYSEFCDGDICTYKYMDEDEDGNFLYTLMVTKNRIVFNENDIVPNNGDLCINEGEETTIKYFKDNQWNTLNIGGGGGQSPSDIVNLVYPVGAIYLSANGVSPETLFTGTTWVQLKSRYLYATGATGTETSNAKGENALSTYTGKKTNGTALTVAQLPSHTHGFTTGGAGGHSHTLAGIGTRQSGNWNGVVASANTSDRNWSTVSWVGDHTHSGTTNATGSGEIHVHEISYVELYVWQRTA